MVLANPSYRFVFACHYRFIITCRTLVLLLIFPLHSCDCSLV